jgi:hypothetical protein
MPLGPVNIWLPVGPTLPVEMRGPTYKVLDAFIRTNCVICRIQYASQALVETLHAYCDVVL